MTAVITLRDVRKSYVAGVPVLQGVDLDVRAGEVTALVGANGSGKSTLVKILSGYHEPDPGSEVRFGERSMEGRIHPGQARAAGVRFVHQDTRMVAGMSVLENLLAERLATGSLRRLDWPAERRRAQAFLDEHGIGVDVRADAGSLSLADAAKISIARAAGPESDPSLRALILDEPTAALGREDAGSMLGWVRDLARGRNVGVLLIGHRLEEILATADRVAVLRSGRIVADTPVTELDHDRLVEQIVGRAIESYYPDRAEEGSAADAAPVLVVESLRGGAVRDLSFTVAAGEILGVTGLPGSGFEDVPYLLMDPRLGARGALTVAGRPISPGATPVRARVQAGLALVPADRKRRALATTVSVRANVAIPHLRRFRSWGRLSARAEQRLASGVVRDYAVSPANPDVTAGNLSGGNQQKVVIGKWMSTRPRVLVVHEPTQAVDIGAKAEIFRLLAYAAADGMAAVVVSVEYEDLAHLCDRVLVVGDGRVVAELAGDELDPESLATAAYRSGASGLPELAHLR
ncbi:MAG: sugar ABC transporter ATP-binding protein [Nocardioidaceae bacterium]|nr:sugar ABC transporter ATP-binding protein [Nocardioidaceae bacterium]